MVLGIHAVAPGSRGRATGLLLALALHAHIFSPSSLRGADEFASADLTFFESRIRPLLAEHCYSCHSAKADKLKGGLHLDSLDGLLKGGELGPAIVPGDPDKSLLIRAVRYTDPDLEMPPKGKKLSDRQIADITRWVKNGAPWPVVRDLATSSPAKSPQEITADGKSWWAFQPIRRPAPPLVDRKSKIVNPIDSFIRAGLHARNLQPNPPATRRELIRRAHFDLIGLPPSPEAIASFEKDHSPESWPRLIDHLLSLPQYGERWGRHWLDLVRFAQSNGYERDGEKPESWRYRDYVVKSFNENKSYDQFIQEQIAGDELERVTPDSLVATGFQRLGVWDDEPDDKRMAEFDELDDILSTTGTTFLGLTIGCARCHEHKFDPIPQADYYRLLAFFRNVRLNENAKYTLDSANYLPLAEPEKIKQWQVEQEARMKSLQSSLAAATMDGEKRKLAQQLEEAKGARPPFEFGLAVRERGPKPPPTHIFVRGNAGSPGPKVQPAFLSVVGHPAPALPKVEENARSSGRRRVLAEWIASPRNPLTARVMANRIWHHHFGRGIVRTTSDFGRAGTVPTHPALLDWLAAELMENGWSMKKLHRTILLSKTYQMSSHAENKSALAIDPGNELLWRQNLRRLEAEAVRDTVLTISGQLNPKMGGRGFFPALSGEVLAGQSRPGLDWDISAPEEQNRRSLYAYVRRTMSVPMLDAFDYSNTTSPLSERTTTTVAPQSLLLLNDAFMQRQARAFAHRLKGGSTADPKNLIRHGFQLALGRNPTRREQATARDFLQRQVKSYHELQSRLTFRPDVPTSLSVEYMNKLQPGQFLVGPPEGWRYFRGHWSGAYEGIRTLERDRGPFALKHDLAMANGTVRVRVTLHNACESAGLLVRGAADGDKFRGYEVVFDPREQRIGLRRYTEELSTLADVPASIPTARPFVVRVALAEERIQVWLNDVSVPLIDTVDPKPLNQPGSVGVRSWGAATSLDDLVIGPAGQREVSVRDETADAPFDRALQAFCLLLLNLNEVVYVD